MFPKDKINRESAIPGLITKDHQLVTLSKHQLIEKRYPRWVNDKTNNFVIIDETFHPADNPNTLINIFVTKNVSLGTVESIHNNHTVSNNYSFDYRVIRYDDEHWFVGHRKIERADQIKLLEMIGKDVHEQVLHDGGNPLFYETFNNISKDLCAERRQENMDKFYETFDSHKKLIGEAIDIVENGIGLIEETTSKPAIKSSSNLDKGEEYLARLDWARSFYDLKKKKKKNKSAEKKKMIGCILLRSDSEEEKHRFNYYGYESYESE
jgi:hypothetical protein